MYTELNLYESNDNKTLGMNVFSDCCLFSFSIFISDRILSLDALNFLCCVSICCIWFISWSISLLMRGAEIKEVHNEENGFLNK